MASTSSSAGCGDIGQLKKIREEIGDEGKFRRMCDSVTNSSGYTVLHTTAYMYQFETCKFLVEEVGIDLDVKAHRGDTTLLIAMQEEHVDIAKYLIEQGADITATDSKGCTALHYCIPIENMEIMSLLLTKGADIEADSMMGTPLHCAVILGSAGMINFLLQNKAEPNFVSKYIGGLSPLASAIYSKNNTIECMELLLKAKADPNKASNGLSPLAHAIEAKANCCIYSLLAAGADVDSLSLFGLRPIEHAALMCNVEAVWMLVLARPRILATPNLSFRNLMYRMDSEQADRRKYELGQNLREKGDNAWDKQDYSSAITLYSGAIRYNPSAELYANRSLCWARNNEGVFALENAEECVQMKPDWGKAHLREATAWHILKGYHMSCDAFIKAYKLDPENENIER